MIAKIASPLWSVSQYCSAVGQEAGDAEVPQHQLHERRHVAVVGDVGRRPAGRRCGPGICRMTSRMMPRLMASSHEPIATTKVIIRPWRSIAANSGLSRMAERSNPCIGRPQATRGFGGLLGPGRGQPAGHLQRRGDLHVADVDGDRGGDGEGDRVGDVGRFRQLEAVEEARADLRAVAVDMGEDVGRDPARADLGDADAPAEGVDAQLPRQHADRGLGGVVGRVAAEVVGAGDRRDVDHVAAVARHHAGNDEPAEMQHRAQVHVHQEVDVGFLGLEECFGACRRRRC